MNLSRLRAFDAVAAHGGFGAAARALGVSQPTVSEQVGALERDHGVLLVDRTVRSGGLTPLGVELRAITARLFDEEAAAERLLARATGLEDGELRIGADAPVHAMPILAEFRRRHPGVRVRLGTANSAELVRRVASGSEDVVVAAGVAADPALTAVPLGRQDLVAVVRDDHPLAGEKTIALHRLSREQLVMREAGSETRAALERAFDTAGLTPAGTLEVEGREAVLAATAAGLGVGVIAENEMLDDPRLVMLDLRSPAVPVTEYLVCRTAARETAVVRAVLEIAGADRSGA